ncbi:AbrB/MazE/SpoVT family DNA-binding domain-containing protein [Nocardia arthritidis]|uniref:AbrB/MazE/SpoVT family DNA-binding domain-containing protein n=2 Tax=Nocardia arthritidis TaxID=228602 RepID=A0A6G9Y8Y8_9NOCA|nr:AbrB/MazE/SpoVT family DNA-binding domain-containing protein [Nocardia arthritidis]
MSTVGEAGRILDRHLLARLGWVPGTHLDIGCEKHGLLVASPAVDGVAVVTGDEFFRIPFRLRRRVSLFIGDRVLLIGRRSRNRLAIHPPAAMDELLGTSLRLLER